MVYNNTITIDADSDTIQGVSLWDGDGILIHDSEITSYANHARAILIDGDSDGNMVFNNLINLWSAHSSSDASPGIRICFGSDNNMIYNNEINSTGNQSFAIRIGGREAVPLLQPTGNLIVDNTMTSATRVLSFEDAGPTLVYGNTITAQGVGLAAQFYGQNVTTYDGYNQDIYFVNNIWTQGDTAEWMVRFLGTASETASDNIRFCNGGLTVDDIVDASGVNTITFDASADIVGCFGDIPGRPQAVSLGCSGDVCN